MDVGVVGEEAFLVRVEEVGAVVDGRLLGWSPAEDFRPPGVSSEGGEPLDPGASLPL